MSSIFIATEEFGLEGGDALLLESGDKLRLESSVAADIGIVIEDGSEAVQLHSQDPYLWFVYEHPSVFFQPEPFSFFDPSWMQAIGQSEPLALMPVIDPRIVGGDIANMPVFTLQLFANAHFGPNGTGDFAEPSQFDIAVKPGEFEIRKPL